MTAAPGRKVLVVAQAWVGDLVMAQALFRELSSSGAEVHVVAPPWCRELLERMPEVRGVTELDVSHGELGLGRRYRTGRALRGRGFERAIVLSRSWKAALVPFFAGVGRRTGFRGELRFGLVNDMRELDRARLDQTVKRYLALGLEHESAELPAVPEPRLERRPSNLERLRSELELSADEPAVALVPGAAYGPAKQWPPESFADLASRLAGRGFAVWILGSKGEQELGSRIRAAASSPRVRDLCGRTGLADAVDLLGATAAAVTNDSGLMHVAAAAGANVVALYGSSSPAYTPPLTERRTIHHLALECSPCFERHCPLGHTDCLRGIGVDAVEESVLAACEAPG